MSTLSKLTDLLSEQDALQAQLRQEILQVESMDFVTRNADLEKQVHEYNEEMQKMKAAQEALAAENRKLKEALVGQAYARKTTDMRGSWSRMDAQYKSAQQGYLRELAEMEQKYNGMLRSIAQEFSSVQAQGVDALNQKIAECRELMNKIISYQRQTMETKTGQAQAARQQEFAALDRKPLTEAEVKSQSARNNLEFRLGGRIANILGVLLILFGVVVGLQYTYANLLTSNPLKSAAAYFLGILFLAGGELLGRKRRTLFSLGITSGGIAILFASTAISLFVLEVLSLYVAFGMCVLIAALAMLLSLRNNSQTIANFALIGGFLPLFAITLDSGGMLYTVMGYLVLLNFFALFISARRGWKSIKYVSLALNFFSTLLIIVENDNTAVNLIYVTLNFALYAFIAVLYPMRKNEKLDGGTMAVVVLNSLFNCLFVFGIMTFGELYDWMGLTALCLAVFYYAFSWYLTGRMADSRVNTLYLATSLVFAVLVVPLQLDERWIAMGWLVEAAVLIVAGMKTKEKWYRRIGAAAYVLSLCAFVLFDSFFWHTGFYFMKLSAIVLTSAFIFAAGLYFNKEQEAYLYTSAGRKLRWMKHYVMALVFGYLLYTASYIQHVLDKWSLWDFFAISMAVMVGYAFLLRKLPAKLRDGVTTGASNILFFCAAIFGLAMNFKYSGHISHPFIPLVLSYIVINVCGFVGVWKAARAVAEKGRMNPQLHPLIVFTYVLVVILQMLLVQARVSYNDMVLSFVLMAAAFVYIAHGFTKRISYTRRTGLALSIAAVVKFFLVDLTFLETWQTILSYFVLGGVLIGISFLYQHFARRVLDLEEIAINPEKPQPGGIPPAQQPPANGEGPTNETL